jgi:hypothetical protein
MVELGNLAEKVFSLLKGNGLQVKIFDEVGSETTDPSTGRRFFVVTPNIMVTIDEDDNTVEFSKGSNTDDSVLGIQKNIRKLADQFMMNSKIKVFGKSIQPKDYAYQAKMKGAMMENEMKPVNHHLVGEVLQKIKYFRNPTAAYIADNLDHPVTLDEIQPVLNRLVQQGKITAERDNSGNVEYSMAIDEAITESFSKMFGSLKTSQQTLENVRILVKHKTPVDETVRGSRSRHISAIFLECNGERFRFPHTYLPGARAMAQHMAHGGAMTDKVGAYITESTGNLLKLQSFNRYVTTNKLINEDSSGIVETVKENIETLRTELKKLTGVKTYETVKARLETFEREALAEDDTSQLKDLFTIRRFDEKFEGVLPIIKQLVQEKDTFHKRIEEAAANVIRITSKQINSTPMFEFASEQSRIGFLLNQFALRIVENEELAGFVNKVGTKLCKEGAVNDFEKAVISQVLENLQIVEKQSTKKEIKESLDIDTYFNRYDYIFSTRLNEAKFNVTFHLKPNGVETMTGIEAKSSDEAIKKAKEIWKPSRGFTAKKITAKEVK